MREYQEKYISNTKKIAELSAFSMGMSQGFDAWEEEQQKNAERVNELKKENVALLCDGLFPALDELYSASSEEIDELTQFASVLMDWKNNLDCGVYVIIHDAILSYYRVKKDRNNIIKELYMLGMGYYYMRRFAEGVKSEEYDALTFRNEMIFTEAASYLRYFEDIEDEATRGYIVRSLHNIALSTSGLKKRIAASSRALSVMKDPYYRELAPGLPWERFVRAAHQQMSIYRNALSQEALTKEELAKVLDSCYEVFRPEEASENRNIRWLWPYYDMEYSCGYAGLSLTMDRMEELIDSVPYDRYDVSGLYANVQLPLIYGQYVSKHPKLQTDENRIRFLDRANRKMMKTLLSCPAENIDDLFRYNIDIVISNFYEIEGSLQYREIAERILRRFSDTLYIRSRKAGEMMRLIAGAALDKEPSFFDDIPSVKAMEDPIKKRDKVLSYALECGLLMDYGIIKMNMRSIMHTRQLFETEQNIYQLHTLSGYQDLSERKSTAVYADAALGHHRWYNGKGGFPDSYVRMDSPYRQMTDIAAVVSFMLSEWEAGSEDPVEKVLSAPAGRFSPMVTAYLYDKDLAEAVAKELKSSGKEYYKEIYDELSEDAGADGRSM